MLFSTLCNQFSVMGGGVEGGRGLKGGEVEVEGLKGVELEGLKGGTYPIIL